MTPYRAAAALLACFLGFATPARAALTDEIQVYTDDINAPGETGLELHVNATPRGRRTPEYPGEATPHHGWRLTPEFSWGLSRNWEAGLYVPLNRDANGRVDAAGVKVRLKWLPVRPEDGAAGGFFGANGELSRLARRFSESRSSFELRGIAGWRGADWLFAVNPVFGWSLSDGLRSSTADLSLGAKASRSVGRNLALGLEYYADAGTTRRPRLSSQQAQSLFAALDARVANVDINLGIGRGLNAAADAWTLKAIFGIPF